MGQHHELIALSLRLVDVALSLCKEAEALPDGTDKSALLLAAIRLQAEATDILNRPQSDGGHHGTT